VQRDRALAFVFKKILDRVKMFLLSSLIIMQDLAAVCHPRGRRYCMGLKISADAGDLSLEIWAFLVFIYLTSSLRDSHSNFVTAAGLKNKNDAVLSNVKNVAICAFVSAKVKVTKGQRSKSFWK